MIGMQQWLRNMNKIRCLSPVVIGGEAGYIQDKSPIYHRATWRHTGQTTMHTLILKGYFRVTNQPNSHVFDCGRKLEYPERTHACIGRTCKLHVEKPNIGNQTKDFAARQQCQKLY
ncbi:hypothetical protein GOODEAATRI_003437 [Goodea atripinnis]|uniref:Uncharacterized protein n=1 Tax=Goodea atripinnis TaxID=208336 RepID=A0ABV0P1B5_9TELE